MCYHFEWVVLIYDTVLFLCVYAYQKKFERKTKRDRDRWMDKEIDREEERVIDITIGR